GAMRIRLGSGHLLRVVLLVLLAAAFGPTPSAQLLRLPIGLPPSSLAKLDSAVQQRATLLTGESRVILCAPATGLLSSLTSLVRTLGGSTGITLPIVNGQVATVPNLALPVLAASTLVQHISLDRAIAGAMERTGATVGAVA